MRPPIQTIPLIHRTCNNMYHRLSATASTRVRSRFLLRRESVNSAARRRSNAALFNCCLKWSFRRLLHSRIRWDVQFLWGGLSAASSKQAASIPASGNRNYTSGGISNVGSNGYYWCASTYSTTNAYILTFRASTVNPSNGTNRTNGFCVRCVRAFTSRKRKVFLW